MAVNMTVVMRDANTLEEVTATLTYLNPVIFPNNGTISNDAYTKADEVGRAICALSNNTYVDSVIYNTISVNEIINA